jgi:hypothetical protein
MPQLNYEEFNWHEEKPGISGILIGFILCALSGAFVGSLITYFMVHCKC